MHEIRVRETKYIWGSAGIGENLHFDSPLLVQILNDTYGEPITIGTEASDGTRAIVGSLQAGESVAIPVQDVRGVFVTCEDVSTVWYAIKGLP
jgi:hypothetical protein